ncbi:hypothetical protein HanXRQr2_Chr11g0480241 [Helianthus annuus]|uniref:Uncharacterized protein n=1 Tax=Helianthus annuus TaxID=4232 RepID=A0A9K3MZ69_HELAN|nr:hypothetical protein HanXRQr2_Chr11g0480241 [Helianthus annuus]
MSCMSLCEITLLKFGETSARIQRVINIEVILKAHDFVFLSNMFVNLFIFLFYRDILV